MVTLEDFKDFCSYLQDGVLISEIDNDEILLSNQSMEEISGYSRERLKGFTWIDLLSKLGLEYVISDFINRDDITAPFQKTLKFINKKQQEQEIELTIQVITTEIGERLLTIFRATHHQSNYERIMVIIRGIQKIYNFLQQSSSLNLNQLTSKFCEMVANIEGMSWIGILDFDKLNYIQPIASAGQLDNMFEGLDDLEITNSNISTVIDYGEPLIIQNIQDEENKSLWTIIANELELKSIVLLPLTTNQLTFGILSLFSSEQNAYPSDVVRIYQQLANSLSESIVEHLFDDTQDSHKIPLETVRMAIHDINNLFTRIQAKIVKLTRDPEHPIFTELNDEMKKFSDHIELVKEGKYKPYFDEGNVETTPEVNLEDYSGIILVVDDDKGSRDLMKAILKTTDYLILEAKDAESALQLIDEHSRDISLVISDVMMPKTSGLELWEMVDEKFGGIQFCFISGYQMSPFVENKLEERNAPFVAKPFKPDRLLDVVSEILDIEN